MRFLFLAWAAGCAALALKKEESESSDGFNTFNSIRVPPLQEITAKTWDSEAKKSKWLVVKHFSPWCHHCAAFAPTYQLMYEFYYASKPPAGSDSKSLFDAYSIRFATIDCTASGDLCTTHNVGSYPTTVLYKDGEEFDKLEGARNTTMLSDLVEKALKQQIPGSRPKRVNLPNVGDKVSPVPADLGDEEPATDKTSATKSKSNKYYQPDSPRPSKSASAVGSSKSSLTQPKKVGVQDSSLKTSQTGDKSSSASGQAEANPDRYLSKEWKGQTSVEVAKNKPQKPGPAPNPDGISVPLTAETFEQIVKKGDGTWFIKFYAPWCPHCQAMAPTWEQMAKNVEGKLNVAEVNCDKEPRLCKNVGALAYPTILFFKGGDSTEYQGLRGLGDLTKFAQKAMELSNDVPNITAKSLKELEEKEDVIFIYFYDHATVSEDLAALERLPLSLLGHAKLVKTNDPALFDRFHISTWPKLAVSRNGRPSYYDPLTPSAIRDVKALLTWMQSVWLPLVPELTIVNAEQLMEGKTTVLAILDRQSEDAFYRNMREMKAVANEWLDRQGMEDELERKKLRDVKKMRIEEASDHDDERGVRAAKLIRIDADMDHKNVNFAWVDGTFWQRWIRKTYGVDVKKGGERVIINEQDARRYWDTTVTGNHILVSRTSILETLDRIIKNPQDIRPKLTVSTARKVFIDIGVTFREHPFLATGCLIGVLFSVYVLLRGRPRRGRGHFRLDEAWGSKDYKDGLLGHSNNTKAD